MHTDPVADMLTRIRNGARAGLEVVRVAYSKFKEEIAKVLLKEGYLQQLKVINPEKPAQCQLELTLRYDEKGKPVLRDIQRLSTPGRRRYLQSRKIPKVCSGLGVILLSTSQSGASVLTDREARRRGVGGEPLCEVC